MDELFKFESENPDFFTILPKTNNNNDYRSQRENTMYLLWLCEVNETTFGEDLKLTDREAMEVIQAKKMIFSFLANPKNRKILINEAKIGTNISTMIEAIFDNILTISQQIQTESFDQEQIEQILTCILFVNSFCLSKQQLEELLKALRLNEWLECDFNQQSAQENDYLKLTNEMAAAHFREYIQLKHIQVNNDMYTYQTVLPKSFVGDAILNEVIYQALNELKYENLLRQVTQFVSTTINCDEDYDGYVTNDSDMQLNCHCVSLDKISISDIQKLGIQILLPPRLINEQISPLSLLDFYLDCYYSNQDLTDKKSVYDIVHFVDYKTFTTIDQFIAKAQLLLQDLDLQIISHQFRYIFTELLLFNLETFATTKFQHFSIATLKQWDPFNVENQIIFIKGNFYTIHKHNLYHSRDIIRLMVTTRQKI